MDFSKEQLAYASGHMLDEFAANVSLTRKADECDLEFRTRIHKLAFPAPVPTDDGGSAFPLDGTHLRETEMGMSLRDYFAAQAMQSIEIAGGGGADEWIAKAAYERADAMLAERAK